MYFSQINRPFVKVQILMFKVKRNPKSLAFVSLGCAGRYRKSVCGGDRSNSLFGFKLFLQSMLLVFV